jgi:hypothetical protein
MRESGSFAVLALVSLAFMPISGRTYQCFRLPLLLLLPNTADTLRKRNDLQGTMQQSEEVLGYLENARAPCCTSCINRRVRALCCGHGLRQTFHPLVHRKLRILTKRELRIPAFYQKHLLATLSHACTHDGIHGTTNLARYAFDCAVERTQRLLAFLFCIAYKSAFPLTPRFIQTAFWVCCGFRPHLSLSSTAPTECDTSLGARRAFGRFGLLDRRFDVMPSRPQ